MASTVAREIVNSATWQSIQAQPYDGERYPCGCHPHPKEPHLRFYLCDYHDGFDAGVDQGNHELRDEVEWLSRALRYISSPTMGLPGGADAAEFCMKGATEQAVRTALRVCIEMARQAMEARRG